MTDLDLIVEGIVDSGPVRTFTLASTADASLLPPFVPGSHLIVESGGRLNAYSLLDDGTPARTYRISVLRVPGGRGGSSWFHDVVRVGDKIRSSAPRSMFAPVSNATHHLLIGGGIGITPLMSHAYAALRWGRSFTLWYRYRAPAHVDELREVCGEHLRLFDSRPAFAIAVQRELRTQPLGTHLYVCGPPAFTSWISDTAAEAGWPAVRLHSERFSADESLTRRPFTVRVRGRGYVVPAESSLLDVLESQGYSVPNRCRHGVCGECVVEVAGGKPEHRDLFLTEADRAKNDRVLPCVSRALGDDLELSL